MHSVLQLPSGGDRTIGAGNAGKMGGAGSYGGMSDAGSAGGGIVGCSITGRVGPCWRVAKQILPRWWQVALAAVTSACTT